VRRRQDARLFGGLLVLCLTLGCATPEARYRVLSVFFDGVPLPESMQPPPPPPPSPTEQAALDASGIPVPTDRPTVEWVFHDPECEECHSSKETKLPPRPAPGLCWGCHDEEDYVDEVFHGPFVAGACLQCHDPHKSPNPPLLVLAVPELCGTCHDATTFPAMERHRSAEGEDCIECHNPHAGAGKYMLESGGARLRRTRTASADRGRKTHRGGGWLPIPPGRPGPPWASMPPGAVRPAPSRALPPI